MKKEIMKCENLNIDMFDLLEGKLDRDAIKEFREHIDLCDACKSKFSFVEEAIARIDDEKRVDVSKGFADKILLESEGLKRSIFSARRILAPLAAAAVIVFGIITGVFISELAGGTDTDIYADLPDEYYYTNEIHLETIETFFLINKD